MMKNKQLKKTNQQKQPAAKISKTVNQRNNHSYYDIIGIALIIILGIIIYSNSFNCSFHFDDKQITDNDAIRNLSNINSWWNYSSSRPMAYFTFALNYHFGKLDVWGYHLVNLMIHLTTSIVVWWLTLLLFSTPVMKGKDISKHKKMIALFTALLFVSHPLATQSVTYIMQRMASMVAMFYLLSLAFYVKARIFEKKNMSKYLLFIGAFIFAICALLTKENAFTLPFAVLLFEIFFLQTKKININFKDYRIIAIITVSIAVIFILFFRFSLNIFNPISPVKGNIITMTSSTYLLTQFSVIVKYIQLLFLPINQNLDYDFPIALSFFELRTLMSFLFLISLVVLAIYVYNKNRIVSFGIFWFFLTLSIESSIIPIDDVIFEHRTYLPSFGFFLILTSSLYLLFWKKFKYFAMVFLISIVVINSVFAHERNKVWKNDLSMLNDVILKSPNKARPNASIGDYYKEHDDLKKALDFYSKALNISSSYIEVYCNRGDVYNKLKLWDKALIDFDKALSMDAKYEKVYYNRGNTYVGLKQYDKALEDYSKAIRFNPKLSEAYCNRGNVYGELKQYQKAIEDYDKAINLNPNYIAAYSNRGSFYGMLGQSDKAIADYSRVITLSPNNPEPYFNRGFAYGNLGQWDNAVADFSKVIEIDPNNKEAYRFRDIALEKVKNNEK